LRTRDETSAIFSMRSLFSVVCTAAVFATRSRIAPTTSATRLPIPSAPRSRSITKLSITFAGIGFASHPVDPSSPFFNGPFLSRVRHR